nr:hypothetical protein [Tanacetum cinerariifolium]
LGLLGEPSQPVALAPRVESTAISFQDAFRETVNVAMGRAAALLARVLGVFVQLPVPNVNMLEVGELHMALADAQGIDANPRQRLFRHGNAAGSVVNPDRRLSERDSRANRYRLLARASAGAWRAQRDRRADPDQPATLEENPRRGDQLQPGGPQHSFRPVDVVHRRLGRAAVAKTRLPDELIHERSYRHQRAALAADHYPEHRRRRGGAGSGIPG